ncbi:MAG: ferredoxin [Candidatus Melainabacteria bacterium]|nr:ferredoxin [Candidatus Melainabacteria bacterium]
MQVEIVPGCIACGVCQSICPEVFTVTETAFISGPEMIPHCANACLEAARACPVQVIQVEE